MSKIKYCLPIIESRFGRVLEMIDSSTVSYSFFEVWLDYIEDLKLEQVAELEKRLGSKLILLFRRKELEKIKLPIEQRIEIINSLSGDSYLDLDLPSQEEELSILKKRGVKIPLILSHHNYKATPSEEVLEQLVQKISSYSPSVIKITTYCNSEQDALRLLSLALQLRSEGRRFIVLGMGEHGKITRIFGTLWGNEFIFAPEDLGKSSAPGQFTRAELDTIFKVINRD